LLGVERRPIARVTRVAVGALLEVVARCAVCLALVLRELLPVEEANLFGRELRSGVGVEGDARRAGDAAARGDQDDAIGTTRSIDRRRAGVLEHLDRLDVRRTQIAD